MKAINYNTGKQALSIWNISHKYPHEFVVFYYVVASPITLDSWHAWNIQYLDCLNIEFNIVNKIAFCSALNLYFFIFSSSCLRICLLFWILSFNRRNTQRSLIIYNFGIIEDWHIINVNRELEIPLRLNLLHKCHNGNSIWPLFHSTWNKKKKYLIFFV